MSNKGDMPAFPVKANFTVKGTQLGQDDLDFLDSWIKTKQGMTLRQWYAGQALNGILSRASHDHRMASFIAFEFADAMLEAEKE